MLNHTLINQFNSSPHALLNDGTLEQFREVMKELFPSNDQLPPLGNWEYYYRRNDNNKHWAFDESTDLPIIPVTSFFTPTEKTVKVSEVMAWVDMKSEVIYKDTCADQHIVNLNIGSIRMLKQLKQYLNNI